MPTRKVLNYKLARMEHQKLAEREAFRQYLSCQQTGEAFGYAFLFPPGTGKSATFINTFRRMQLHEGRQLRTLILCPPVVIHNWKDELLKFSDIHPKSIVLLNKGGDQCVKLFEQSAFDHLKRKLSGIYITNYEKIVSSERLFDLLRQWQPEVLVCDESHRLKNPRAKRTRAVDELANPSVPKNKSRVPRPSVFPLSGTPILNSLLDIFSQFLVLDGGASFGDNFFAFRARYFRSVNIRLGSQRQFLKWVPRAKAGALIQEIVAQKSMTVKLEDCLDLPPLLKKTITVEMTAEQKHHYEEMRKKLITYVEGRACVASIALTKFLRLMQIASGYVPLDNGEIVHFKNNLKLDALSEIVEDVTPGRKLIVWAVFKENYRKIREVFEQNRIKFVEIHGDITGSRKRDSENAFQNDDNVRALVGHPGAGGIGINLTAGSYSVYFSSNFSKENRDQSWARDYRKGSERHSSITKVDLVTRGTIEEEVLKKLDEKNEISLSILRKLI